MTSHVRIIVLIALAALIITGCAKEAPIKTVDKISQVSVVTLNKVAYKETISYTGFISARQILPLSFQQNGIIDAIKVTEGQKVKSGDALMTLKKMDESSDAPITLYASIDGIVSEIINKSGDLVGAGYPVAILRSIEQIMQVGVTDVDLVRIDAFGNPVVTVNLDGKVIEATLDNINKIPDETSRTYSVTVALDKKSDYLIGKLGTVFFELSRINGIWLPISYIQNDGEDYVYIVNSESRIERRNLKLKQLNNDLVRVEGLEDGNRIVTVGNSIVKEGQKVIAREATNE